MNKTDARIAGNPSGVSPRRASSTSRRPRSSFHAARVWGACVSSRFGRADWQTHPEAVDRPAGPPPRDDGPRAEALSRERPTTGARSVTGLLFRPEVLGTPQSSQGRGEPVLNIWRGAVGVFAHAGGSLSVSERPASPAVVAPALAYGPGSLPPGSFEIAVWRRSPPHSTAPPCVCWPSWPLRRLQTPPDLVR